MKAPRHDQGRTALEEWSPGMSSVTDSSGHTAISLFVRNLLSPYNRQLGERSGPGSEAGHWHLRSPEPRLRWVSLDGSCQQAFRCRLVLGYCSAVTRDGWRWIVDAHRNDGRRYIVHSDELLSAFWSWKQRCCDCCAVGGAIGTQRS